MSGLVHTSIWPANDGSVRLSTYPVIPVEKTTSPEARDDRAPSCPKLSPSNTELSSRKSFIAKMLGGRKFCRRYLAVHGQRSISAPTGLRRRQNFLPRSLMIVEQ